MADKSPDPSSSSLSGERPTKKQRRSRRQSNQDSNPPPNPPGHDTTESNITRPDNNHRQPTPLFTAHRQPVPGLPPPYSMNTGGYPMNGSSFPTSHSPFPQPSPNPGGQGSSTSPTDPHASSQHQYAYPNYSYPAHSYPQYPQYPQPIMMYGPPRPPGGHEQTHASPSPVLAQNSSSASSKRKRASILLLRTQFLPGLTSGILQIPPMNPVVRVAKTQRLVLTARNGPKHNALVTAVVAEKSGSYFSSSNFVFLNVDCVVAYTNCPRCDILPDTEPPVCQHCKQYGFECTFFLPIAETRFKKKKVDDEASAHKDDDGRRTASPRTESQKGEVRVYGPTSAAHLIHSQALITPRTYESYDSRYNHTWEVSKNGDGLIHVHEPSMGEMQLALPKPMDMRVERDMVEKLLNVYFTEIAPIFPVITQAEFLASPSPSPILLYSCCLVAAARREVPQTIFDTIRYAANNVIKAEDVMSTASIVNVQSLLILCMVADSHSQFVPNALSGLWVRAGTAIRMAQDLGLHRAESVKQNIELRRRLWGACVIADRWISLIYGHPYMIDVQDCDARLPSSGDPNDPYMDELVRLSVLLGRVLKTIYTPAGLALTNDEELATLLSDLEAWRANLPDILKFRGLDTSRNAGLLFLLYSCVNMIFWRVFMRISYTCPSHLKFSLTIEKWSALNVLSGDAIDWLDKHENMYDVWLLVAYSATSCALVQYHTWARRRDTDAQAKLKKLRDCVRRWEASISPDHMSARRKTAEIIALLYEATLGPLPTIEPPALNPTSGVKAKPPVGGLIYKKDASRPGGGVFVAQGDIDYEQLPEGLFINDNNGSEGEAAPSVPSVPPLNDKSSLLYPYFSIGALSNLSTASRQGVPQNVAHAPAPSSSNGPSAVNIVPLSGGAEADLNVNPVMNNRMTSAPGNVQVMNVLDVPQASNTLEQFAMADMGLLEGIPGGMFDWGQWDTFFSRFSGTDQAGGVAAFQQHQQRIRDMNNTTAATQAAQQQQQSASQFPYSGPTTRTE